MTESEHKYLIFTMSGRYFAFDLLHVAEVMENPTTWPIPLAPPCYPGAMNFHGNIIAVLDLAMFLGFSRGHGSEKTVVLDSRVAALAFSVERIVRITSQAHAKISWIPGDEAFALGQLNLPEGKVILLNATAIAEHAAETING